jgi:hypothetical protein
MIIASTYFEKMAGTIYNNMRKYREKYFVKSNKCSKLNGKIFC